MHEFDSEAEAVAALRDYLDDDEISHDELALVIYGEAGNPDRSVTGPELSALAFGADRSPYTVWRSAVRP
jgi:hypothetical protein